MDRSNDDRRRNQRAYDDRYDRVDRYERNAGGPSLHGRYQYGPEEDPHQWDDRWRGEHDDRVREYRAEYSRIGEGPSRDRPYRGPSQDEYRMYREGNDAGYDGWHGHSRFHDPNDFPTARNLDDRERENRWRDERRQGHDPGGTWRQFEDWTHSDYGDQRSQGYGYRRRDDYDDRFWGQSGRSRGRR